MGERVLSPRKPVLVGVLTPLTRGAVLLNREVVEEDTKVEGVIAPSLSREVVEVVMVVAEEGEGCNNSILVEPRNTRVGGEGNLSKEVEAVVVVEAAVEGPLQVGHLEPQHPSCTKLLQLLTQLG